MPDAPQESSEGGRRAAAGCNVLAFFILAFLVAAIALWAFLRNPPSTPDPTKTGSPAGVPSAR